MQLSSPFTADMYTSFEGSGMCQQFPSGLRVLLCDSHNSADTASLQHLQYQVTHAADVEEAAALLSNSSSHFDVVLADTAVLGPGMASASTQAVFEAAGSSGTPVVLMTQHYSSEQVLAAVHAGAADVLERPLCYSKLQNLWQHSVRASLTHSKSAGTKYSSYSEQHHHQHDRQQHLLLQDHHAHSMQQMADLKQHAATPRAASAPAPASKHSPMCFGLLDDCLIDGLDGLGGLELPPLVPSQLDFEPLESILTDMQAEPSAAPVMGSLGAILPPGSPSLSNAATAVAASLFGCSSEQQCSGNMNVAVTELESCADASSAGSPLNRRRKLRACTPLRSMAAGAASGGSVHEQWAAAGSSGQHMPAMGCPVMQPGMHMAQQVGMGINMNTGMGMVMNMAAGMWGSQGTSAGQWGSAMNMGMCAPGSMNMFMPPMPGQLPRGMVWGMPVRNVAVAPGIVPAQTGSGAAATGGTAAQQLQLAPAPTLAMPVAPAVQQKQQSQQPFGGMQVPSMWPGMWGGMWPPMCYPGMPPFPGMFSGQSAQTGCCAPGAAVGTTASGASAAAIPGLPQFSAPVST